MSAWRLSTSLSGGWKFGTVSVARGRGLFHMAMSRASRRHVFAVSSRETVGAASTPEMHRTDNIADSILFMLASLFGKSISKVGGGTWRKRHGFGKIFPA